MIVPVIVPPIRNGIWRLNIDFRLTSMLDRSISLLVFVALDWLLRFYVYLAFLFIELLICIIRMAACARIIHFTIFQLCASFFLNSYFKKLRAYKSES